LIEAQKCCTYKIVNTETHMVFEWDDEKAKSNIAKHHVSFELAKRVWDDPFLYLGLDDVVNGEQRWRAVGMVDSVMLLVVIHTTPDKHNEDRIRIISARQATRHERKNYEQG
jgi:uncharacterized protein